MTFIKQIYGNGIKMESNFHEELLVLHADFNFFIIKIFDPIIIGKKVSGLLTLCWIAEYVSLWYAT